MDWIATIVVGVLAFMGTAYGAYSANRKQTAVIEVRLEALERKVDKHNQVIERTFVLEKEMDVVKVKQKESDRRIEELEDKTA